MLLEGRHIPSVPLRPNTQMAVRKMYPWLEVCQRSKGCRELSLQEEGQVDDISSAIPQPNKLGACRTPKWSIPFAGSSAPRCFLVHLPGALGPNSDQTLLLAGRRRLSQISWPSQPDYRDACRSQLQVPLLRCAPACIVLLCAPALPAQQRHHCCLAGRVQPLPHALCRSATAWLTKEWLRQTISSSGLR